MRTFVRRLGLSALGLATVLLATCSSPEAPEPPPQIAVSVTALNYSSVQGTNPSTQSINVSNTGGGTLGWTAASSQSWLTVSPASGTGAGTVTASVAVGSLTAGTHTATVTIAAQNASNTPRTVAVTLTLTAPPTIGLSPTSLNFTTVQNGPNPANQTVALTNTGGSTMTWATASNATWLTATPASGTGAGTITVAVNNSGLTPGSYNGQISVSAAGATNTPQVIAVALTVQTPPAITLSKTSLDYTATVGGADPANQTFDITNSGGATLNWTASDDASWLTLSPTGGTATSTVTPAVSIAGLAAGTYNGTITVSATGASNSPRTIAVTLTVNQPFNGTWTGKTSQDSTITLTIANNAVTNIYIGWRVASCGTTGTTSTTFNTPFSVASGSFNRTVSGNPMGYTISGTFTSGTAVSGNLTLNFSMSVPFSCSATVNLTWSATKQ
jgi:hypothetical protein